MYKFLLVIVLFYVILISCGSPKNDEVKTSAYPFAEYVIIEGNDIEVVRDQNGNPYLKQTIDGFRKYLPMPNGSSVIKRN